MIEKVNPQHPDKVADRIAGAIVDLAYECEKNPKVAVEVLIGHGCCHAIIETSATLDERDIDDKRLDTHDLPFVYTSPCHHCLCHCVVDSDVAPYGGIGDGDDACGRWCQPFDASQIEAIS